MPTPNTTLGKLDFVIKQLGGTPGTGGRIGQYSLSGASLSGDTLTFSNIATSLTIHNIDANNDGAVSFDSGVSWTNIPKNYGSISLSTDAGLKVEVSNIKLKSLTSPASFQVLTIEPI